MIITGFLASLNVVNFTVALIVLVLGDVTGDSIYYIIGKYGKETFIRKYGHYIGIDLERERKLETYFSKHADRTLLIGKFAHGAGSVILIAAGLAKVAYSKVLGLNLVSTTFKALVLMLIGYYYGKIYLQFNAVLNYISLIVIIAFVFGYIVVVRRKVLSDIDKSPVQESEQSS